MREENNEVEKRREIPRQRKEEDEREEQDGRLYDTGSVPSYIIFLYRLLLRTPVGNPSLVHLYRRWQTPGRLKETSKYRKWHQPEQF